MKINRKPNIFQNIHPVSRIIAAAPTHQTVWHRKGNYLFKPFIISLEYCTGLKQKDDDAKFRIDTQKDVNFPSPGDLSVIKLLVKKNDVQDANEIIKDINQDK